MHQAVGRDHAIFVAAGRFFQPKFSTGAFDNQAAGGDVPKADAALDVNIQPAAGDIRERERGRTEHADFHHAAREPEEIGQGAFEIGTAFGKADGNDAIL